MDQKLTKVRFHGELGRQVGESEWNIQVSSVGEAMRAVEILSKRKLFRSLLENDKKGAKYKVLINSRPFLCERTPSPDDMGSIASSELVARFEDLDSVDVVPVIEGADGDIGAIIGGVVLIIVGIVLAPYFPFLSAALIMGGIGLIAAGVINMLTSPPAFEDFREIGKGGKPSYLFGGPQNTVGEGNAVPVLYGELLIGSQTIAASYDISQRATTEGLTV